MSPGRPLRLSEQQVITDLAVDHLHPPLLPLLLRPQTKSRNEKERRSIGC